MKGLTFFKISLPVILQGLAGLSKPSLLSNLLNCSGASRKPVSTLNSSKGPSALTTYVIEEAFETLLPSALTPLGEPVCGGALRVLEEILFNRHSDGPKTRKIRTVKKKPLRTQTVNILEGIPKQTKINFDPLGSEIQSPQNGAKPYEDV